LITIDTDKLLMKVSVRYIFKTVLLVAHSLAVTAIRVRCPEIALMMIPVVAAKRILMVLVLWYKCGHGQKAPARRP